MKITMDGEYTTRSGLPVRIYATDGGTDKNAIHGAYLHRLGWVCCTWLASGRLDSNGLTEFDLVAKPKVRKLDSDAYVVRDTVGILYVAGLEQVLPPSHRRVSRIRIQRDITEGEGL